MGDDIVAAIRDYWEDPATISIIDANLHRIEVDTVSRHLEPDDRLADIGCGNGRATVEYARVVKECIGYERSERFRQEAREACAASGLDNLRIEHGDLMEMKTESAAFDCVVTQRLLINLESWERQQEGLEILRRLVKPGGRLILIENTDEGTLALNHMREAMGMKPIGKHWHNHYFQHQQFLDFMAPRFELVKHYDFGLYYLLTRVYVPMFASFTGSGAKAVKDPLFDQADQAARKIYEALSDRVGFPGAPAVGPVQGFVFRRPGD